MSLEDVRERFCLCRFFNCFLENTSSVCVCVCAFDWKLSNTRFSMFCETNSKRMQYTICLTTSNNDNNDEHDLFVRAHVAVFYGGVNAAAGWLKFNF